MTVLEVIVVLAVVAAIVFAVSTRLRRAREHRAPWRLVEDSDDELLTVYGCRQGQERLLVGSVPVGAEDFAARAGDLRERGEREIDALNAGRRV
jgi:hypothetical protein